MDSEQTRQRMMATLGRLLHGRASQILMEQLQRILDRAAGSPSRAPQTWPARARGRSR